ncbi:hypothetical protein B0T22DRAFT_232926 [Podospora appendiculata]|uniref:Uncharacterized protein n=1 Tax=Podospora appendiculata TaxID=314037 RepID=A0AAE1CAR4_9PEZI|nr:hypothetical protein B0T22DRAFT_232926 [Podospora appendiculata]
MEEYTLASISLHVGCWMACWLLLATLEGVYEERMESELLAISTILRDRYFFFCPIDIFLAHSWMGLEYLQWILCI